MMFKKLCLFLLILCLTFQITEIKGFALATNKSKVLIVYDKKTVFGYSYDFLSTLEESMGAFDTQVNIINITDYTSSILDKYDYVFILSIYEGLNNGTFIKDVQRYKKKLFIIGKGIEAFLNNTKKYDLIYSGDKIDCNQVFYSNNRDAILPYGKMDKFYLKTYETFSTVKITSSAVKVLSYVSDGLNYYPLVINEGNLWYLSALDDNVILLYIFCDILNDIFQRDNIPQSQVFIRIEDVSPLTDINKLKSIADYLYSEQIPYIITLIPTYTDPQTNNITTLSEKNDFVKTILYMQNRGGSVILQYVNNFTADSIGKGISSCVESCIYPLGVAAPKYVVESKGYLDIKNYFSTYVGEFNISYGSGEGTKFPYKLYDTRYFNKLVPENLGHIDAASPMTLAIMEENFRQVSIVRGYTTGLSFQPDMHIDYLKSIVSYLKVKDARFFNLKNEENWVKIGNVKITSENGKVDMQRTAESKDKSLTKSSYILNANTFIIILILIFCSIFIILIVISRKIYKNKYYR